MMILMLLVVLFVLFVKVMPIFSKVYEQLGAEMSPVAQSAIRLGGIFSGVALVLVALIAVVVAGMSIAAKKNNLKVGDEVKYTIGDQPEVTSLQICGIYKVDSDFEIYFHIISIHFL